MPNSYNVKPVWGSSKPSLRDCNWESGPDRKLAHNTYRVTIDGQPGVMFHRTVILRLGDWDGVYILNSGGWRTFTTKQRLNALLPGGIQVWQKDFEWFVSTRDGEIPFEDGMKVTHGPGW